MIPFSIIVITTTTTTDDDNGDGEILQSCIVYFTKKYTNSIFVEK